MNLSNVKAEIQILNMKVQHVTPVLQFITV